VWTTADFSFGAAILLLLLCKVFKHFHEPILWHDFWHCFSPKSICDSKVAKVWKLKNYNKLSLLKHQCMKKISV
jgi:hypothetical protein